MQNLTRERIHGAFAIITSEILFIKLTRIKKEIQDPPKILFFSFFLNFILLEKDFPEFHANVPTQLIKCSC